MPKTLGGSLACKRVYAHACLSSACTRYCIHVCELLCAIFDTFCDGFFCRAPKVPKLVDVVVFPPPESRPPSPAHSPAPSEVAVAQPSSPAPLELVEGILTGEGYADNNCGGEDSEE